MCCRFWRAASRNNSCRGDTSSIALRSHRSPAYRQERSSQQPIRAPTITCWTLCWQFCTKHCSQAPAAAPAHRGAGTSTTTTPGVKRREGARGRSGHLRRHVTEHQENACDEHHHSHHRGRQEPSRIKSWRQWDGDYESCRPLPWPPSHEQLQPPRTCPNAA